MALRKQAIGEIGAWVKLGRENPFETVLLQAHGDDLAWMDDYGIPVTAPERAMAAFLFAYDRQKLIRIGEHIADAFLHGFVSQNRNRAGRKRVRFSYQIGQEALAQTIFAALTNRGLAPCVQKPGCLTGARTSAPVTNDAELLESIAAYEEAFQLYEKELRDTCGMVGVIQFGQPPRTPTQSESRGEYQARLTAILRRRESELMPPSTLSFCKVAFPNTLATERFAELFEEVAAMNLEDSEPYERMQQKIIDALDGCQTVRIIGRGENRTDLTVTLRPIADPGAQSIFLNCGGDLNIPYGEVFTTPLLKGTSGLLHVREVFLQAIPYRDLELTFRDGYVSRVQSRDGAEYVHRHLLFPHKTLTAGEFALGTNTRAYEIVKRYGLLSRMPILWLEKMGPHVAVGDPCFARGEDAPVCNLFDGKEMIARDNERTAARGSDETVYYNKHIDITLPYEEIGMLYGVTTQGETRMIVRDGCFVLPGTEGLNTACGEQNA